MSRTVVTACATSSAPGGGGDDDWKVYFYTPRGLGHAFEASRIAGVREEPWLQEQDFGNFQDRDKMRLEVLSAALQSTTSIEEGGD
uniref:Uncharacterized protein n=1 Tax=Oryza meridionalis TaxID=40149 RepID=A0A0E0DG75_9ORYZ